MFNVNVLTARKEKEGLLAENSISALARRSDYYWQHQVYREKLPGNLPLTKANIEAAEFGVKLIDLR